MHAWEMVLSARRNHSESSMRRTCVKVVCVRAELRLNLETLTPATCALKHFYASGWWKNRHRLQLFYARCLLLLCGAQKRCGRMNGRWRPTARAPMMHCSSLCLAARTQFRPPPFLNLPHKCRSAYELQTFITFSPPFCSASSRRSSCICFQQKHPPAIP